MKIETLDKANEITLQISLLKQEQAKFDSKSKYVHLQIQDNYGNKSYIIQTYAQPYELTKALGYDLERNIADEYGDFLDSIKLQIQKRINSLIKELDNL